MWQGDDQVALEYLLGVAYVERQVLSTPNLAGQGVGEGAA